MTVHQKVEAYFMESENQKQEVDLRERILNQLAVEERRVRKAIQATDDWFAAHQDVERLKQCGDILMSNLTHVPAGAAWFEGKDFFHNDNTVKISLDKELSGAANAKKYYSEYKKKKIACERKRVERSELSRRLKGINDNIKHVADTHDVLKLQTMARRLDKKKQSVSSQDTPGLSFISGGYTILVGRTAKENEELYRRHVRGNDLWMHTRDFPGASVFIRSIRGKSEPLEVILDAANLAVFYSKAKSSGKADLYYTRVKYLKKAKGGKTGLFLPTQEKNLNVRLDQERIRRLKYKDETID